MEGRGSAPPPPGSRFKGERRISAATGQPRQPPRPCANPPPPGSEKRFLRGNSNFVKEGNGHCWYANPWILDPLPLPLPPSETSLPVPQGVDTRSYLCVPSFLIWKGQLFRVELRSGGPSLAIRWSATAAVRPAGQRPQCERRAAVDTHTRSEGGPTWGAVRGTDSRSPPPPAEHAARRRSAVVYWTRGHCQIPQTCSCGSVSESRS